MAKIYEKKYKERLNTFLYHIQLLDDDVKLRPVFSSEAGCATILDFTGPTTNLVMQVANKMPNLLDNFMTFSGGGREDLTNDMNQLCWANALALYLGFSHWDDMNLWTLNNTRLWGSDYGLAIFRPEVKITYYSALHRADLNYIIKHWAIFVNNINSN